LSGGSSKSYPITKQNKKTWKNLTLNTSIKAYPIVKEIKGGKESINYRFQGMADRITQTIEPHEYPDDEGDKVMRVEKDRSGKRVIREHQMDRLNSRTPRVQDRCSDN